MLINCQLGMQQQIAEHCCLIIRKSYVKWEPVIPPPPPVPLAIIKQVEIYRTDKLIVIVNWCESEGFPPVTGNIEAI